jgi:hypothetical protein
MAARPLDEKLAVLDSTRQRSRPRLVASGKGRPPLRQCPEDFDIIFVEVGRLDCETYYRAARITVDRWLDERGKDRLIKARAAFVEHQRAKQRKPKLVLEPIKFVVDRRKISLCLARAAADYLRKPRNGGWIITRRLEGDWRMGHTIRGTGEMLDIAVARGFDIELASKTCDITDEHEARS